MKSFGEFVFAGLISVVSVAAMSVISTGYFRVIFT